MLQRLACAVYYNWLIGECNEASGKMDSKAQA